MTRIQDWEKPFNQEIQKHMDIPFEWGVSDCYMLCDDVVKAITGKRIETGIKYKTELSGTKQMIKKGYKNFKEVFSDKFEEINPSIAMRGDLGIVSIGNSFAGGVFTSLGFMTKGEQSGIVILPHDKVHIAFKV